MPDLAESDLVMKRKWNKQRVLNDFRPVIQQYVNRAKELDMRPVELALQIGGPEVDTCFLLDWADAEQEIAYSWLRLLEKQVH